MRILLIGGGWSNEREVSLSGAEIIRGTLNELGHQVTFFDPAHQFRNLPELAAESDFAFINLHGSPGEDGLIQALLEQIGLPYQGSGPAASKLALNKAATKSLLERAGLPTPAWEFLPAPPAASWRPSLKLPLVLKPNTGGSSLNVQLIETRTELEQELGKASARGDELIIEQRISGPEITCGVLESEALPPILIEPADSSTFFDYYSKYTPEAALETCPAPISEELTRRIQDMALHVHTLLGLHGYSRTDFILENNEHPVILEVNTLPGMTPTSLFPQEAAALGYSFQEVIHRLIQAGCTRSAAGPAQDPGGRAGPRTRA